MAAHADLVARRLGGRARHACPHLREIHFPAEEGLPRLAEGLPLGHARDRLGRAVEGGDPPLGVDGDEPRAHGLEDEVAEGLKVGEVSALGLEVPLGEVVALGQGARESGDGHEHARVEKDREDLERGHLGGRAHPQPGEGGPAQHHGDVEEAGKAGGREPARSRREEAPFQHGEHVEEGEDGARAAARRDDAGDEGDVDVDLQPCEALEIDHVGAAHEQDAGDEAGRESGGGERQDIEVEAVGVPEQRPRGQHHGRRDEARPAETAQGAPERLRLSHRHPRYLTRVTSLKIGRYMATTRPPMSTPSTTIMMGSRRAVMELTATSTSSS